MSKHNSLVEGALFCAIFIIMLMLSAYIPPVGAIGVYFLPLPITVYAYRNNLNYSLMVLTSSVILSFMLAPPIAIINAIMAAVMGVAYGSALRKKYSPMLCFVILITVSSLEFAFVELMAKTAFGFPVIGPVIEGLESFITYLQNDSNLLPFSARMSQERIDLLLSSIATGIFSLMGILNAFIIFSITAVFFKKLNYEMVNLPMFEENDYSKKGTFVYVTLVLLFIFGLEYIGSNFILSSLVVNIFLLMSIYYWVKGYMIYCRVIGRLITNKILASVVCLVSYFILVIPLIIIGISVNFKRIKKVEKNKK